MTKCMNYFLEHENIVDLFLVIIILDGNLWRQNVEQNVIIPNQLMGLEIQWEMNELNK